MTQHAKAKVFMNGRSQNVRIPAPFRFDAKEVYIRRDAKSGDIILSAAPGTWQEFFVELDKDPFPQDFLADRNQGVLADREAF